MQLNFKQLLALLIAVLSVLAISTTNLADLFGDQLARVISSASNLVNALIAAVLSVVTSQTATIKDVAGMEGVTRIRVNAGANQTLAAIAMDPDVRNVMATSEDAAAVSATADGSGSPSKP